MDLHNELLYTDIICTCTNLCHVHVHVYACHTTGDEFKQYCNSVLEQQQLVAQEVEDVIKNLTRKYDSAKNYM